MARKNKPKLLLVGNGLNRCFSGPGWEKMISDIAKDQEITDKLQRARKISLTKEELNRMPYPLQIILACKGKVDTALKNHKHYLYGQIPAGEYLKDLRSLLVLPFDMILTSNFGYEIEMASFRQLPHQELLFEKDSDSEDIFLKKMQRMQNHTIDVRRSESRYMLHTYYDVSYQGVKNRVFHIHGEARKTESIILEHYQYGNVLRAYQDLLEEEKDRPYLFIENHGMIHGSWVDAFLLGDVYTIGFGFGFSELDMWWLLNRKGREKSQRGHLYFYEPFNEDKICKFALIEYFGGTIRTLDYRIENLPGEKGPRRTLFQNGVQKTYEEFYQDVIREIRQEMES